MGDPVPLPHVRLAQDAGCSHGGLCLGCQMNGLFRMAWDGHLFIGGEKIEDQNG
jgi:hypothetical protein